MQLEATARLIGRRLLSPRARRYVRRWLVPKVSNGATYRSFLNGKRGLEIGGPSELFSDEGSLPVYYVLGSLDNSVFAAITIWAEQPEEPGIFRHRCLKGPGRQFTCDATNLKEIGNASYECVLASHCLEHIANPLRALEEWRRVLTREGLLVVALPHKEKTFDWRRAPTSLLHMVEDFENGVGEDDMSHLPEILAHHDLSRDSGASSQDSFRRRCMENSRFRAMHHHVFDTAGAVALLDHAGFQLISVDTVAPMHILILARCCDGVPDNQQFLHPGAAYRAVSCFSSDR